MIVAVVNLMVVTQYFLLSHLLVVVGAEDNLLEAPLATAVLVVAVVEIAMKKVQAQPIKALMVD